MTTLTPTPDVVPEARVGSGMFEPRSLLTSLPEALRKRFGDRPVYRARAIVCRVERFEGQHFSRVGARFLGEAKL